MMPDHHSSRPLISAPPFALVREKSDAVKFDTKVVAPFCERSVSEETRRAYRRREILNFRDHLMAAKKSASTVTFKLSIIRSMFDYLRLGGYVHSNPALAKLVPPPALPEELRGRALTSKEVGYLLAGPDRRVVEGARGYALLLLMLRTSLRVSEACKLKASSIKWSHGRWVLRFKVKGGRERAIPRLCCKNQFETCEVVNKPSLCCNLKQAQDELRLLHRITST